MTYVIHISIRHTYIQLLVMEKKMKFCWWQPKVNIKYKIVGKEGMAEKNSDRRRERQWESHTIEDMQIDERGINPKKAWWRKRETARD